jgi:hypothetical protein
MNGFTQQTLPTVNSEHFFMNIPCIQPFYTQKTHNRTLLFGSTILKHGRHFDYQNQPLNMRMRVCNLDFFLKIMYVQEKGIGNAHQALCSTFL